MTGRQHQLMELLDAPQAHDDGTDPPPGNALAARLCAVAPPPVAFVTTLRQLAGRLVAAELGEALRNGA